MPWLPGTELATRVVTDYELSDFQCVLNETLDELRREGAAIQDIQYQYSGRLHAALIIFYLT